MQGGVRKLAIQSQPDKALGKLMQRKQAWKRGKEQLSAMFYLRHSGHTNRAEYGTSGKVGGR